MQKMLLSTLAAGALIGVTGTPALAATHHHLHGVAIQINTRRAGPAAHRQVLGANMRWTKDVGGAWNPATRSVYQRAINHAKLMGMSAVRYPGGTAATMFNWHNAVTHSGCQIEGHWNQGLGFWPARKDTNFGPNQFMRFADSIHAQPLMMTPFVRETPHDAANWVEYMNARVGTNPGGGRAWARLRAFYGHPAPYGVHYWEVGNESQVVPARYGMSNDLDKAIKQYANGGVRKITHEALGKGCLHPTVGVPSNGHSNQVFSVLFPAIVKGTLSVTINGQRWTGVRHLRSASGTAHVYTANLATGDITFGDGVHGAIPPNRAVVHASYHNTYAGYFAFAHAMHAVDPRIAVCSSWGLPKPSFPRVANGRHFDCQTAHPMTNLRYIPSHTWNTPLQGHDWMMGGLRKQQIKVTALQAQLPRHVPLLITESNALRGNYTVFPNWSSSVSHMLYQASMQQTFLRDGISWVNGSSLFSGGVNAVLGSTPNFTRGAEALERMAVKPMFHSGHDVKVSVVNAPVRNGTFGRYSGLSVTTTKSGKSLWLMVVNRLPGTAVKAHVNVGVRLRGKAQVRRVSAAHFTDYNTPTTSPVKLTTGKRAIGRSGFQAAFPAHSVSVYHLTER